MIFLEDTQNPDSQNELWEELGIRLPRETAARYFFGDRVSGYFEGYTHSYLQGSGYLIGDTRVFADFAVCVNGWFQDRKNRAAGTVLYPWGVECRYRGGIRETLHIHTDEQAVSLKIQTDSPAVLSLLPLLPISGGTAIWDDGILFPGLEEAADCDGSVGGSSLRFQVAIIVDKQFHLGLDKKTEGHKNAERVLFSHASNSDSRLWLESAGTVTEITFHFLFDTSRDTLKKRISPFLHDDPVTCHKDKIFQFLTRTFIWTSDKDYNRALMWAKLTGWFLVVREYGRGIWAGLPWFRDFWGRDTFISLPGILLVSGCFQEAKEVIRNFAALQNRDPDDPDYGRIPNRVTSLKEIIYNTTDGTPWFIREVCEYLRYTGDLEFAREIYPVIKLAIDGPVKHRTDRHGFLFHDDADTWMDARIEGREPWSARGNRAVEVQALWFTALSSASVIAEICGEKETMRGWLKLAERVKSSFLSLFWWEEKNLMADRLYPDDTPDYRVRPNQLLILTVPLEDPLVPEEVGARVLEKTVEELLFPYGITSLSQNDPVFHPFHENPLLYHKDAAYHNGIIWGWNSGFTVTALLKYGKKDLAWELTKNLGAQILDLGCRGTMSELLDAYPGDDGNPCPSGTWAQAWSVAEFTRNGYQDYPGFRPNLLTGSFLLSPSFPERIGNFHAQLRYGENGKITINYQRSSDKELFVIAVAGSTLPRKMKFQPPGRECPVEIDIPPGGGGSWEILVDNEKGEILVNRK